MLAQAGGELEAVDAAEAEIEEDDRRSRPDGELEAVLAGLGHQHASIGKQGREVLAKGLARVGIVLDDKDYAHQTQCTVPAVRNQVTRRSKLARRARSEEHTSELQSLAYLVCRLLLEKKKKK